MQPALPTKNILSLGGGYPALPREDRRVYIYIGHTYVKYEQEKEGRRLAFLREREGRRPAFYYTEGGLQARFLLDRGRVTGRFFHFLFFITLNNF